MKTQILRTATLTLATLAVATTLASAQSKPAAPGPAEEAVRKAVLETNTRMSEAVNRMDVDAFFSYILDSESTTIIQSGTVFKTRQEAMQAVRQGFMGVAKMDRRFLNPQVTVISPDTALLIAEGTVNATLTDGRTMDARFAVSLVFVRRDGQWKLLHGHYSMPVRM